MNDRRPSSAAAGIDGAFFVPDAPCRVETESSIWIFRPDPDPGGLGGWYLRLRFLPLLGPTEGGGLSSGVVVSLQEVT